MTKAYAYAGIGSRDTPADICQKMNIAAQAMSHVGLILRSGAADGADKAFEAGSLPHLKEIYLPWPRFNGSRSTLDTVDQAALDIAAQLHQAWYKLSQGVRKLMARNCYQVLGRDLQSPVLFVLCWTPGGKGGGGTGQAIRLAKACQIPVFDMGAMGLEEISDSIGHILLTLPEYSGAKV